VGERETARLRLRPFTWDDLDAHAQLYADPEVTGFLAGGAVPADRVRERSRQVLENFIGHWARHGFGPWAVIDKEQGRLIGQCGLRLLPDGLEVELLYALERAVWGMGLAPEAAGAALRYGFLELNLSRIVAVTRPEHAASRRVMEKLGMTYERDMEVFGIQAVCYALSRADFGRLHSTMLQ
jgi:RimJ/RimL family protein N-acetyltransferase